MRICLVTKCISPHQTPFCEAMLRRVGASNFTCVTTEPLSGERTALGWGSAEPGWMTQSWRSEAEQRQAAALATDADVLLSWVRDWAIALRRARCAKPTFYGFERWFKPPLGRFRLLHPRFLRMVMGLRPLLNSPHFCMLPAGLHAAHDMRWLCRLMGRGSTRNPMVQWGYLVDASGPLPTPRRRVGDLQVLWVGRLLALKRVDLLIAAIRALAREGHAIRLSLIGAGPEETPLRQCAKGLPVVFEPSMPITEIRLRMRAADVYAFPSGPHEGWGAVLNEAMLEGCAVVASDASGAATALVKHRETGLVFPSGSLTDLVDCLRCYLDQEDFRVRMACAGQAWMSSNWTPDVAADRLIQLVGRTTAGGLQSQWEEGILSQVR